MNIWVDISNAPHVVFFKDFISEWKKLGHNVVVTARDLSGSLDLLNANGIEYTEIGCHYGASKFQKLKGLIIRCMQLRSFLSDKSIDVAMSQSSFYSPIVAKMLNTRCVYTNDNEFAKGNVIAHLFANQVIYPESMKSVVSSSKFSSKFSYYPGTKEGIYLCHFRLPKKSVEGVPRIGVRPEPWTAQYHKRDDKVLVDLIKKLNELAKVYILPRDKKQSELFSSLNLSNVMVIHKPLSLTAIYNDFDFFLGAGGSMSRELAFLGLPCLSMYQGELLSVDKQLISIGAMVHNRKPSVKLLQDMLHKSNVGENEKKYSILIEQGKQARKIIEKAVLSTAR